MHRHGLALAKRAIMRLSRFIREPDTATVEQYRRRVYGLAAIYVGIVGTASAACVAIIVYGRFFVTLSQRSNVETLTLAVVLILFAYLALLSIPGAWGTTRILWRNVPAWFGRDRSDIERRKQAALMRQPARPIESAYLNRAVRLANPTEPITIPIADAAGSLGTIVIRAARMTLEETPRAKANSIFSFVANRLEALARATDPLVDIDVVQWAGIDDDAALQYASLVEFAENLERHLSSRPLWPCSIMNAHDIDVLRAEVAELCAALRDEALLPDIEFEAEHRLPIIPEPLAFISLSRHERRVDPVSSMGCALLVTAGIFALVIYFILVPPWVPSK